MLPLICLIFLCLNLLENVSAIDPFSRSPVLLKCLTERQGMQCNGSFAEAHNVTKALENEECCDPPEIEMYLFTRRNRNNPEFLHSCGGNLPINSYYKAGCKTVIYIPGWLSTVCNQAYPRELKDQFLFRGNYNVILINCGWREGQGLDYSTAVKNSRVVGKLIAMLIQNIMKQTGAQIRKFHVIGHSLGAQMAAFTGQKIREVMKGKKLRRITGLDPALPGFHVNDLDERLDSCDADWVDIIHTNVGPCLPFLGDYRQIGHADFYVNGGSVQYSCYTTMVSSILKGDLGIALGNLSPSICFHLQAIEYFKVSINACRCQFIGVECDSYEDFESGRCRQCGKDMSKCAVMGMDWDRFPRSKGNHSFYLKTGLLCPYCNNTGIDVQGFSEIPRKGCSSSKLSCFE